MDPTHEAPGSGLARRNAALVLALLVAATFALRLVGLGSMLPHQVEPDAVIVWQAEWLERRAVEGTAPPGAPPAFYPLLLAELVRLLPGSPIPVVPPSEAPLAAHLAAAAAPYLRARLLVALVSLLAVPAAYLLARAFLDRGPSLLAAAFAATSLLLANYGQQARPHAASAALCALSVAAALVHLRRGGHVTFALAAAVCAASLAALHNGVFGLPALFLAWWFAPRRSSLQLAWAALFLGLAVRFGYALHFTPGVVTERDGEIDVGGQVLGLERFTAAGFAKIARGLWTFDPLLVGAAAIGLVVALVALRRGRVDRRAALVVGSFPAGFLLFWGLMEHMFPRFTAPLVPFLAVPAAAGIAALARGRAFVPVAALVLALPAYAAGRLSALRAAPDTLTSAAQWLAAGHDPARDVVAHGLFVSLPVLRTRASVEFLPPWARGPWDRHLLAIEGRTSEPRWNFVPVFRPGVFADRRIDEDEAGAILAASGASLAIVAAAEDRGAEFDDTRRVLERLAGIPVASVTPFDPDHAGLNGSGYELSYFGLARVLASEQWGPPLSWYALPTAR